MAELIDKNSPHNLSERDRSIYERWLNDRWSISYRNDYLRTDHWNIVKKEMAIWAEGRCSDCGTKREPKHYHHNHVCYENPPILKAGDLWMERYNDVHCKCATHHQSTHFIFPDINCKVDNFLSKIIYHETKNLLDNCSEKIQSIYLQYNPELDSRREIIKSLVQDSISPDKDVRENARLTILNNLHLILDIELGHYKDREKIDEITRTSIAKRQGIFLAFMAVIYISKGIYNNIEGYIRHQIHNQRFEEFKEMVDKAKSLMERDK